MKRSLVVTVLTLVISTAVNASAPTVCRFEEPNAIWTTESGAGLYWDHFPLSVELERATLDADQMTNAKLAMKTWNIILGKHVFRYAEVDSVIGSRADITVSRRDVGESHLGLTANVFVEQTGRIDHSRVMLEDSRPLESDLYYAVFTHEFGHVLGLDHDRHDRDSVMFPYSHSGWNWDIRQSDVEHVNSQILAANN